MNVKENSAWEDLKKDGRNMWNVIDWNGKCDNTHSKPIHESQIQKYLKNIFQADQTRSNPIVTDISHKLHEYYNYIPMLDDLPSMSEL